MSTTLTPAPAKQALLNIPASAFAQPSPAAEEADPTYWAGYAQGVSVANGVVPSSAGVATDAAYDALVTAALRNPVTGGTAITIGSETYVVGGYINSATVGWNEAILDGADWEWINNAMDGHNEVLS